MTTRQKPRYQPGDRIDGRYQVHQALMGGMGEVYLCLDLEEMLPFALKTFQQRYQSEALRTAFEQEVATWVAMEKHPNIVRCFTMDILDNQPFMILEWIAGEEDRGTDLRSWLRYGPLDLKMALEITIDVVCGLIHAQEKQPGIVHRDLKPENILVAEGRLAKITDFGLAQIVNRGRLETQEEIDRRQSIIHTGGITGTPAYMAPEQWRGEALDERTDIYAIGCILYEMLTGQWPFWTGFNPTTPQQLKQWLSAMQASHESGTPLTWPVELPLAVKDLISTCLAKKAEERPTSLTELLKQLAVLHQQQFNQPLPDRPSASDFTADDYNNRGITYHNLNLYEKALADYQQAIDLDPDYAGAFYNRARTYKVMGQYEKALENYQQAITLNPNLAQAYNNRGLLYKMMQLYDEALADYQQAINLNPNYVGAYNSRGILYVELHQYEAALADFEKAIDLDPKETAAYLNRGNTYRVLQQYEAALTDFGQAIGLNPDLSDAYGNRGITYAELHQYEAAIDDFKKAIDVDPDNAKAYFNLGFLLVNTGDLFKALPCLEQAARLGHPKADPIIVWVRQMLGELPSAPPDDPTQAAFEAFRQVDSVEVMRQVVNSYSLMIEADFIIAMEQFVARQVPPEHRPHFKQRLAWLKQIAQEQNP